MSVKAIFAKINQFFSQFEKFSGSLGLLLVFALAGLTFLNNQLNFDIPASTKVRDAAGFTEPFAEVKKLDLRTASADVPATSYSAASYTASRATIRTSYATSAVDTFSIYPVATSRNDYISPYETRALAYGNFIYGHSGNVMNWVKSASAGDTVSVNGKSYRIDRKLTLSYDSVKSYYYSLSNNLQYRGYQADAIIMTCGDGTYGPDGNNNSYRTFLFLKA